MILPQFQQTATVFSFCKVVYFLVETEIETTMFTEKGNTIELVLNRLKEHKKLKNSQPGNSFLEIGALFLNNSIFLIICNVFIQVKGLNFLSHVNSWTDLSSLVVNYDRSHVKQGVFNS